MLSLAMLVAQLSVISCLILLNSCHPQQVLTFYNQTGMGGRKQQLKGSSFCFLQPL